jgi:hypothetical protein
MITATRSFGTLSPLYHTAVFILTGVRTPELTVQLHTHKARTYTFPDVAHKRLARLSDPPRKRVGEVSELHGVRIRRPAAFW